MAGRRGSVWERLKDGFRRVRDSALELSLVLWIARVSVVSAAIGAVLFIFIPQVRDPLLEIRGSGLLDPSNIFFWTTFLISAVVFWALPVHYAARRDIEQDPVYASREMTGPALWVPRVLALLCTISIAISAYRAQFRLLDPDDQAALDQTGAIMVAALFLSVGLWLFLKRRRDIFSDVHRMVGTGLMLILGLGFFALFLLPTEFITRHLWRAPLLPLLLGGWVPVFAWLAYQGRRYHVPFILLLFLVLEGLAWFGDNHNVRRLAIDGSADLVKEIGGQGVLAERQPKGFKRESIEEAITRWKAANHCANNIERCPRPIVIAGSGGASRAGFFTAAFLGEMMDRSAAGGFEGVPNFRKQVFAISTVSGSSVGAAFFIAALDAAPGDDPPCKPDKDNLVHFEDQPDNWRRCMEQLLAGDFISPTLYGFFYRDAVRGLAPILRSFGFGMQDRAEILELSWEDRFCLSTEERACDDDDAKAMRAPFLSISGLGHSTDRENWIPILLLNATDVETGRRVVISPLSPRTDSGTRVFLDAYDLHDFLVDETARGSGPTTLWDRPHQSYINKDVRLSTAALLSARFPLISPPGNILNARDQILTRIIDGGYFENFGAATALEIVHHLKQAGLKPFVVQITNDPEFLVTNRMKAKEGDSNAATICSGVGSQDPLKLLAPPIVDARDRLWFSGLVSPIRGLLGSRGAQGGRALRVLRNTDSENFLHIRVQPIYVANFWTDTCDVADVSMSWWLSKHVQKYLDRQIDENCPEINQAVLKMRGSPETTLSFPSGNCIP